MKNKGLSQFLESLICARVTFQARPDLALTTEFIYHKQQLTYLYFLFLMTHELVKTGR